MTKTNNKYRPTPKRDPERELEDVRDDCIAVFLNSGLSQEEVHAAGGPTPGTIRKWLYKETRFPQFATIRSFLKACGADLVAMSTEQRDAMLQCPVAERLDLSITFAGRPTMPRRKDRKAARKEARRAAR